MPVPTDISQLSQTAASNYPTGSESPNLIDNYFQTYASYIAQLRDGDGYTQEATVASAATTDIGSANSLYVQITGTTTITSFGTVYTGPRFVRFAGALTLTHNATTLILPGAANITTAAGDTCVVVPSGNPGTGWRVLAYQVGAVVPGTPADGSVTAAKLASNAVTTAKIADANVTTPKIADQNVTTPKIADANITPAKLSNSGYELGLRNRIINGAMMIDQRNAGASVTQNAAGIYTVDRWQANGTVTSKFTVQRNAASVTPPSGFTNYLGCTSSSAYTVGASETYTVAQQIEGFNVADLGWGGAGAQAVILSFWVRSSLTGTFGGSLQNSAQNRSYPFTFSVSAANTWEQKSITIAGDTTGTWLTDNGIGVRLNFSLGTGSTLSGTAGAWAGAFYTSATGATSVVGTNAATFYITGVQLERGSTATPFEFRPYGMELALCQRYYQSAPDESIVVRTTSNFSWLFPVPMRSAPTMTIFGNSGSGASFTSTASGFYQGANNTIDSGVGYTASAEL